MVAVPGCGVSASCREFLKCLQRSERDRSLGRSGREDTGRWDYRLVVGFADLLRAGPSPAEAPDDNLSAMASAREGGTSRAPTEPTPANNSEMRGMSDLLYWSASGACMHLFRTKRRFRSRFRLTSPNV